MSAPVPDSPAGLAPIVRRLILSDFRSYAGLDLSVGARLVALTGENGAGKTNILEALSLFTPGRGLRRAELAAMARQGGPGVFAASVLLEADGHETRLGTGTERAEAEGGLARRCRVDGAPVASPGVFAEHVRVVWLTPALDGLFTGSGGDRRRFLDRLVLAVDAEHGARVNALDRALRSRNRLLEDDRAAPAWIDAVEREVAETAVAVSAARRETVERLAALILAGRDDASPFPWAALALEGPLEAELGRMPAVDVEDLYRSWLREGRARDRAAGRTLVGPQAADLAVRHGPKDVPAAQASTGEQKALLIGLVLAHARLVAAMSGIAPLVLLDEVAAHLDPRRREALYDTLSRLGSQVWMTGADSALFGDLPADSALFEVTPGRVKAIRAA
ncbi:DNA replication/repair protein RecF [Alsobacter sp. SYSU M60028]|uniref:DNA replication and repair protein RecF n=1 Tax=Alsobacter ponti TaxID=2962936 RepID=A0ABT1LAX1_9HYPH|nr:DNA replication/repair protein RecF [Alsobacter ponti]MCP8938642.1 DNA replication/repair protein RecF [Alsobacter ponti]